MRLGRADWGATAVRQGQATAMTGLTHLHNFK